MKIILNTTLKVFLSELQNFPPQNVTYSNRLYRGLCCFISFISSIVTIKLKRVFCDYLLRITEIKQKVHTYFYRC